ncbi:interleukin-13 [Ctenodactylus gundi]
MAFLVTVVLALACFGGLTAPSPVCPPVTFRELVEELVNITQDQKTPLCNGSMVWSVNLTADGYCAAREALTNVSSCSAIQKTQKILNGLCPHNTKVSSLHNRDTKIEMAQFMKSLLKHLQWINRYGKCH